MVFSLNTNKRGNAAKKNNKNKKIENNFIYSKLCKWFMIFFFSLLYLGALFIVSRSELFDLGGI